MTELCKVNYPLYCCQCVNNEAFIVAGGGGAAKTGVRNSVEILELCKKKKKCVAQSIDQLDTTTHAVMSLSAASSSSSQAGDTGKDDYTLALSMSSKCSIYSVTKTNPSSNHSSSDCASSGLKNRKKSSQTAKEEEFSGISSYKFHLLHEIDAVPGEKGFQSSVCLSRDGKFVASGGSDGHVRAWKLPGKEKVFDSQGHKDDVTSIDISPDCKQIASVSRDGKAFVWDAASGHKTLELHAIWNMQMISRSYHFRNCRFAIVPDHPDKVVLFTSHTPVKQGPKMKAYCCVTKWAVKRDKEGKPVGGLCPAVIQHTGKEPISALTVSDDGLFVGIGFMEGSVAIYIAFSLQCAYRVNNLHSIFVTSLSFVKENQRTMAIVGDCDAALVSVSADCSCKMTKLGSRTLFSLWLAMFLCVAVLAVVAFYLHSVGVI